MNPAPPVTSKFMMSELRRAIYLTPQPPSRDGKGELGCDGAAAANPVLPSPLRGGDGGGVSSCLVSPDGQGAPLTAVPTRTAPPRPPPRLPLRGKSLVFYATRSRPASRIAPAVLSVQVFTSQPAACAAATSSGVKSEPAGWMATHPNRSATARRKAASLALMIPRG